MIVQRAWARREPQSMARILCIGSYPVVVESRKAVLEQAGHDVVALVEPCDVAAACQGVSFDVAIIGQSNSPDRLKLMASDIRRHSPSAKILELYLWNQNRVIDDADAWLQLPVLARDLIQRVLELVNPKIIAWPTDPQD